eukprot:CAMPEP_0202426458 /NCGR_PEP_ID=MMETSP1345-20130828/832_1 /ASSEMBLY_ACC=CAM_ASM_000843 /TAXON_ID=342563 /ORGANISM="Fabrea Fabrea salina" /LENGTH=69 /DNA_ID=CAMNT_0049036889 /DNA_START=217 /DNA_END=426 /DNA_ORIENTATION=+
MDELKLPISGNMEKCRQGMLPKSPKTKNIVPLNHLNSGLWKKELKETQNTTKEETEIPPRYRMMYSFLQ